MEKLMDRISRPSDRRNDSSSMSWTGESFRSASLAQTSEPDLELDKDDLFGLFQLWPLKSEGFEVDETRIELWLADFLPLDIPYARIFTYGYNSGVAFTGTASRVDDYARALLERLMAKRRQFSHAEKRPLLFICHSLGGVVVKRALILAHEKSRRYSTITNDTFGIMFFGTPHRGSDVAFWGKFFGCLADVVTLGSIRTKSVDDLKRKSEILGTTCSQFVERSESLHRIFSIYERVRIKGLPSLIVEEDSAVIGLPNEIPIPIEADHKSMCRFSSMKSEKYQMVLDCIKEMVDDALDQTDRPENPLHEDFLRCLKTLDPEETLRNVPRPSPGTCSWINETKAFTEWRDRTDVRLLWISGVPGVGKTTASRFLVENLRRWLQRNHNMTGKEAVVAFFFCSSKQWLQTSESHVIKSLLYQLLVQNRHLFRYLNDTELKSCISSAKTPVVDGDESAGDTGVLWKLLTTVLQRDANLEFWIVIDAVDELEDRCRVGFLHRLQLLILQDLGRKLKLAISDRSSPAGRGITGHVSWLNIRHSQDRVSEDVRHFINAQLADLCSNEVIPWQHQNMIEEALVKAAEGNFLQASLAWNHFKTGVSYWSPHVIKSRLEGLRQLSGEAKAFYCSLLERIPEDSQEIAKVGFTWVLGSRKPLNLTELQHAVAISTGQKSWSDLIDSLGFNFDAHFDQAFGYLLRVDPDLSVRFAHTTVKELLTSPSVEPSISNAEVLSKFRIRESDVDAELAKRCIIVLSFRDFVKLRDIAREAMADRMKDFFVTALQSEEALQSLNFAKYDEPDSAHSQEQETSEGIEKAISKLGQTRLDERTRSLFAYCVSYWNYHCNQGSSDPEVCKSLTNFALLRQSHYFLMVAMLLGMAKYQHGPFWYHIDQFSRLPALHFMLRAGDHPEVLENLVKHGEDINGVDCHGWTPIVWALLENRPQSLELILAHEETRLGPTNLCVDHVLHLALKADVSTTLILRLLADLRIEVNARSKDGWTALQWCLSREHLQPLAHQLLRRKDVDIYEQDSQGLNAIDQIFSRGWSQDNALKVCARPDVPENWFEKEQKVLPTFLSYQNEPVYDEEAPRTFIHRAASLHWVSVEDLILQRDPSKAVIVDRDGLNLVERYAYHGVKQRLVRVLNKLPNNIFQGTRDCGSKLLILCVQQDWEQIVNVLIHTFSVDDNATDGSGRTIAHWASELQWQSLPALLASKSRDWVNKTSHDGRTALHDAADYRNETSCKALLQAGASCFIRDKTGKYPIHIAAEQGHRAIVSLLLKAPIKDLRAYEDDTQGRSLLHYLVMWHSDSFLRQRLPILRPQIEIRDRSGKTPLHFACIFGNEPALSVLLDIGADPNRRDSSSFTPLHHALMTGSVECTQTLVRCGARHDLVDKFERNIVILATLSEDKRMVEYVARFLHSQYSSEEISQCATHSDRFKRSALHYLCHWIHRTGLDDDAGEVLLEVEEDWEAEGVLPTCSPVGWLIKIFATLGTDVNGRDYRGYTPLHTAAMTGNLTAAQALLRDLSIGPSLADNEGLTPLDWAVVNGYEAMATAIEAHNGVHSPGWKQKVHPLYRPWQSGYGFDDDKPADEGATQALAVRDSI